MPDTEKRKPGRPPGTGTGRTTRLRNMSITDEDYAYLLSLHRTASQALRQLIADHRARQA